jgi:glycosyltransferase involved in cell wall biosynthesis
MLFAGTFSSAYDFTMLNKIVKKLKESHEVEVTISTSQGSTELWRALDYNFLTSVSHHEMPRLINSHDIGVSVWKNDLGVCLSSVASTKTAEFLACGRPVIINFNQGDFGRLILNQGAGVVTFGSSDSEIEDYAEKIVQLINDGETSERCRNLALGEFNLETGVNELLKIYRQNK